jgi:hypothetical protein
MKHFLFAAFALCLVPSVAEAKELIWKTEAKLAAAETLKTCDPNTDASCGDHVAYAAKSAFGVTYFYTYIDGTMLSHGFGTVQNSSLTLPAAAVHEGAFDWGGVEENGVFKPLYVVKRFHNNDETLQRSEGTALYMFRLMPDGTSCQIDMGGNAFTDTAEARAWVEKDADKPTCLR